MIAVSELRSLVDDPQSTIDDLYYHGCQAVWEPWQTVPQEDHTYELAIPSLERRQALLDVGKLALDKVVANRNLSTFDLVTYHFGAREHLAHLALYRQWAGIPSMDPTTERLSYIGRLRRELVAVQAAQTPILRALLRIHNGNLRPPAPSDPYDPIMDSMLTIDHEMLLSRRLNTSFLGLPPIPDTTYVGWEDQERVVNPRCNSSIKTGGLPPIPAIITLGVSIGHKRRGLYYLPLGTSLLEVADNTPEIGRSLPEAGAERYNGVVALTARILLEEAAPGGIVDDSVETDANIEPSQPRLDATAKRELLDNAGAVLIRRMADIAAYYSALPINQR